MQRLGFLKVVAVVSPVTQGTTLEGITSRFQAAITHRVDVAPELAPRVARYVGEQGLHARYGHVPSRAEGGASGSIEIQDLYLSDPALPSKSGAITGDMSRTGYRHTVYVEMPPWAVSLRLLREHNYTLTDRGRVLLALAPRTSDQLRTFDSSRNPFLLTVGERLLFLYSLIDADGDLLRDVFRLLLDSGSFPVSRSTVGEYVARALERVRSKLAGRTSGVDLASAAAAAKVAQSINSAPRSGMGPRESFATPRVEPLVDCGLLRRTVPSAYEYDLTPGGRRFFEALADSESVTAFLGQQLAGRVAGLGDVPAPAGLARALSYIASSYQELRSGLGYVSLRELCILAAARALASPSPVLEIEAAEEALFAAARQHGGDIRFSRARWGGIGQVRINHSVIEGWLDEQH